MDHTITITGLQRINITQCKHYKPKDFILLLQGATILSVVEDLDLLKISYASGIKENLTG